MAPDRFIPGKTYNGYFLGAGDEYALSFLPGLFWKTEYRFSRIRSNGSTLFTATACRRLGSQRFTKQMGQTIRSELTYHFNWGGPVVAKY